MLPTPWADNSRSMSERGPSCRRSTAAAESRVSALAMKATTTAASSREGSARASRSAGRSQSMASPRLAGTSTRRTSSASQRLARVARLTPSSAPGRKRRRCGRSLSQPHITAMVPSPSSAASRPLSMPSEPSAANAAWGNASRLSRPDALGARSSITCNCERTMRMPMPASIPYTTAGEVTRNQQPRRSRPASSWMAPASSRIGPSMATP